MKILDKSFTFYKKKGGEFNKETYLYLLTRKSNKKLYNDITRKGKVDVIEIDKRILYNLLFSTIEDFDADYEFNEIEMPDDIRKTLNLYNVNFKENKYI